MMQSSQNFTADPMAQPPAPAVNVQPIQAPDAAAACPEDASAREGQRVAVLLNITKEPYTYVQVRILFWPFSIHC
jgi:hypothetical protein